MNDNGVKPLPLDRILEPHNVRRLWNELNTDHPNVRRMRIDRVAQSIRDYTYDETGPQLDAAVARLLPDVVDKGSFAESIDAAMTAAEQEAQDETPVREWDGGE